jgi:hypothetical protein
VLQNLTTDAGWREHASVIKGAKVLNILQSHGVSEITIILPSSKIRRFAFGTDGQAKDH